MSQFPAAPHVPAEGSIDLAVIGGDGIGPEVTAQALAVLQAALAAEGEAEATVTEYPLGADHWKATGEALNAETLDALRRHDAILFGAVGVAPGDTEVPSGLLERQVLLKLRFELDHAVNLRPTTLYPGAVSPLSAPGEVDFTVVREGTEGPYAGNGGQLRGGTEQQIATEVSVNTAYGVERVVRYAFARAQASDRKKLTFVHKHNVLVHAGHLWKRVVEQVAADFPEVTHDYLHVDAATILMVTDPARFDVIVTDNLFGDILTDLAAAIGGGIGLAASGNINVSGTAPSMFEPVHGSAPDIAGQGIADPTAAVLSAAMALEHLGRGAAAERVHRAVWAHLAERTAGEKVSTEAVGRDIAARL
ncbi:MULTISPECIES: 3-isopropylmalate dehydrogenase [Micrococcus]|uniref:3-isopropylmalate dehydrogenase n=1 Tax=Micrococcus lylae TaxID=1273 RepID=A0ABY2K2G8_9MICC|nr:MULTISPECIES: 3-isopropylmalate dehydrogenase [Micrococcus]OFR89069.1 3-isopropylmalate dehydrogenase [Micrococcus sp. HMSC067E09]TFI01548.1 3-isopropylmalate dehydrogenase [Micrococcus lylae]